MTYGDTFHEMAALNWGNSISPKLTARFCFHFDTGPPTPCRHVDGVRFSIATPQTKKTLAADGFGIVMGVQPDVLRLAFGAAPNRRWHVTGQRLGCAIPLATRSVGVAPQV